MVWCKNRWLFLLFWGIQLSLLAVLTVAYPWPNRQQRTVWVAAAHSQPPMHQPASPSSPTAPQRYLYQESFTATTYKRLTEQLDWNTSRRELTLALRDQIQQQETVIAGATTNDAVYVVWRDLRNDEGDIYLQLIDARGNRLWPADLRVNTDDGAALQAEPAVAIDPAGNLWIAWIDNRNGNNDIYAQRISRAGQHFWLDDQRVNQALNTVDQGGVSIALLPNQDAVLAWHDNRTGSDDIYVMRLTTTGAAIWPEPLRVNSDMTNSAQSYPTLAVTTAGAITVAWLDQRIGNSDIYAQQLTADGQLLWPSEVRINQPAEAAQSHPRLAINPHGQQWLVWTAAHSGHLVAQQINSQGEVAHTSALLVSPQQDTVDPNQQPGLTVAADGTFVAVWANSSDGNLYAQRFNEQGTLLWSQAMPLQLHTADGYLERTAVAVTATRQAFIMAAWADKRANGQGDVYSQALDQTGKRQWPQDQLINDQSGTVDQQFAAVTTLADGGQVVAWQDGRRGPAAIYVQRLTTEGHLAWSAHLQATTVTTASGQLVPDLASIGNDTFLVWSDNRTAAARLYLQRFDKNGNRQWPQDQPLNHPADPAVAQLNPALTSDQQGRLFVVWEEISTTNRRLVLQQVDATGAPLWREPLSIPTGAAPRLPDVKAGPQDSLYVTWVERSADGANLFLQRITAAGAVVWPTMIQANRTTDEVNALNPPAIGVDGTNQAVVVWVNRREGAIMAQRLTETGQPVWPNDVVINATPGGFAPLPDLVVLPNGHTVVVWQQIFEKRYTIAAQRLDGNGAPLWQGALTNNQAIIVSVQANGAQRPRIVANAQDNAVVVWQERRFNNWDIMAQQLSPTGELTWPADTYLAPQEKFYFATGSVESTIVNQRQEPITTALLQATYQRNGGAVHFWLSNDDGQHWATVTPGIVHNFSTNGSALRWKAVLQAHPHNATRVPTIQALTLEYEATSLPLPDPYEADDQCTQARPLQMNGLAQKHTLATTATQSDEDWVTLTATYSGPISLIAQTAPSTTLQMTLYQTCTGAAIAAASSHEEGVATLTISGTMGTPFFVQLRSTAPNSQPELPYALAAYSTAERPLALIVAGAAVADDAVANHITQVADRAYRTLRKHGYLTETIYLLSSTPERDVDGDGRNDVDALTSPTGVQSALTEWLPAVAKDAPSSLLLFVVGMGHAGAFQATVTEQITAEQLQLWLANAEKSTMLDQTAVIVEMNQAGQWISRAAPNGQPAATLPGLNRIILTATDAQGAAWHTPTGIFFSDLLWTALDQGASLWEGSVQAQSVADQIGYRCATLATPCQQPWLDDTGDGRANQPEDGALAQAWRLSPIMPATVPIIQAVTIQPPGQPPTKTIEATLAHATAGTQVMAEIVPPTGTTRLPENGLPPVTTFPVIPLQPVDDLASSVEQRKVTRYRGVYAGFSTQGSYRVIVYAQTGDDVAALPVVTLINTSVTLYLPLIAHTPLMRTD